MQGPARADPRARREPGIGLVGFALNAANYRGAVSSLQTRMESYVYLVLAAMEVSATGSLEMDGDFTDPRLIQPSSGIYIEVKSRDERWTSASSLGLEWPQQELAQPGRIAFTEPGDDSTFFTLLYGVGWQLTDGSIEPFTVSVLVESTPSIVVILLFPIASVPFPALPPHLCVGESADPG